MTERTRVVVAGAGPVGGVLAYRLAEMGIDVVVIEPTGYPAEDMRASTFHPPSLAMMQELGVLDEMLADGLKAPVYQYRNRRSGHVISLDMGDIADMTPYPFRLQCEQFKLARILTGRLANHKHARMLFQHRLLSFEQDSDGVTVHVEGPMAIEHFRADYLIGADGASSTVRKWLGVEFDGFTYPERFLTLSTAYPIHEHYQGLANVSYMSDAQEWCVLLRVPKLWRVLVPSQAEESEGELLSDAKKTAVFGGLVPDGSLIDTYHRTIYRVHQRVARNFRRGRVVLMGDAAHLNNPLGGFGMNSGIHDAWNLSAKLGEIMLGGGDSDALLDHYERQRKTVANEFVQAQTIKNKEAMEAASDGGPSAAERQMDKLAADLDMRRDYMMRQAMIRSLEREAEIA
jgi:3-(3-hydroxy-phenyl)propionate hydroxylase